MRAFASIAVAASLLLAAPARAADFQIDAETIGQAYQLAAADGTLVNRRRITQYLGLHIFNIGPHDDLGRPLPKNQLYITISMRFDADMGDYDSLAELTGRTPERELFPEKLDLLYAYLGGHDIFGFVDFELGRQIMVDLYDWTSFDGLHVQARAPFHVAAEVWGGLNVDGAGIFDSPLYRADGVALGGNQLGSLSARQEEELEPTFGVAARTYGLRWFSARVSYERTMSETGEPRQAGEPEWGVVDEHVGLTARANLWAGRLVPWFAFRYNLLAGRVDEVYAGARTQIGRHGISLEYVLAAPTFDGDSIWNVFATQAFDDVRLGYDVSFWKIRAYAQAFTRLYFDDLGSYASGGGSLGGRLALGSRGWLRLDGYYEDGYGGLRAGVDASTRVRIWGDDLGVHKGSVFAEGRLSFVSFRDDSRPEDAANSFGVQAGVRWTPLEGISVHGLVEENVNRLYTSQLRVLALLDLSFWLGMKPRGIPRAQPWSGL
ncbi:MAG TPA: hypothetical protein VGL86_18135 [Polyangia bacterium]